MANDTIGANVSRLRRRQNITQEELAFTAGVSRSAVASIEGGRYASVRTSTVLVLAEALGVKPETLMRRRK